MPTTTSTIGNFYLSSTWRGYRDPEGTDTLYTAPNTGYGDYQYNFSLPVGAVVDNAVVTGTLGSPYTGVDDCFIYYNGTNYNFKPGSLDITSWIQAVASSGYIVFRYRFKANGGAGGLGDHTASLSINNNTITITYHLTTSSFSLSTSSLEAGQSITVTISPVDATYRHTIDFAFGSATQQFTNVVSSQAYTIPLAWMNQIPNTTSGTAVCTVSTYNSGGTLLGTAAAQYFTVTVPASIVPTLTSLTPSLVDGYWGLYVQGKSRVTLTANGAAGAYGSTIVAYSIAGSGSNPYTTGILYTTGTNTFYATVTDSRGKTSSAVSCNISVTGYSPPVITGVTAQRASDANGTLSDEGTYVKCTIYYTWSAIGSNYLDNGVDYKATTSGTWVSGSTTDKANGDYWVIYAPFSTDVSYDIRVYIKDYFSTWIYAYSGIQTSKCIMDIRVGGNGIAFGKVAEADNLLELAAGWTFKAPSMYGLIMNPTSGECSIQYNNGSTMKWVVGKGTLGTGDIFGWYYAPAYKNLMTLDTTGRLCLWNDVISIGTASFGQFRAIEGNYGFMIRNDGNNTFLLITASGDQYGVCNSLRPFQINHESGLVSMQNGVNIIHSLVVDPYTDSYYSEGIRLKRATNGWCNIQFGSSGERNGVIAGQWLVGTNPAQDFLICKGGNESGANYGLKIASDNSNMFFNSQLIFNSYNFSRGTGVPSGGGDLYRYVQYI